MAVHVPLSFEAQLEARMLMLSTNNILLPSSGRPVAIPSQDIVLGCYYLTKIMPGSKGEGAVFSSIDEALSALDYDKIALHAKIKVRVDNELVETTAGRLIFSQSQPEGMPLFNQEASKKAMESLIRAIYAKFGQEMTVNYLDRLKKLGFEFATKSGVTVSIDDLVIPEEKNQKLDEAYKKVARVTKQYRNGLISVGERYNSVKDIWNMVTDEISTIMFDNLAAQKHGFNPVFMMADSGARGSKEQIRQLAGMRGLMAKPQKKITGGVGELLIDNPITSNFREGLSVQEYFISTHGARKGLSDTALKTADAGYLTRRLVDVAQDVIIREVDCNTILGIEVTAIKEGEEVIESLSDRILGRVALYDIYDPITDEVITEAAQEITEEAADRIEEVGIDEVAIRSVLTCESKYGVCAKCYGRNLATLEMVKIGEAVGVIAAQSIGEPGTQLTLRTFHIGGVAGTITEQSQIESKFDGKIVFKDMKLIDREDKTAMVVSRDGVGEIHVVDKEGRVRARMNVPYGSHLFVKDEQNIKKGEVVFESDPYISTILTEKAGKVKFKDVIKDVSFREEVHEQTGSVQRIIVDTKDKTLFPAIIIEDAEGKVQASYRLPVEAQLQVNDGQELKAGDPLVKMSRFIAKSGDITGGLPRVAELFEARRPHDPAVISEIDGIVEFGKIVRGQQQLIVTGEEDGTEMEYLIPHGKHLMVHAGDKVFAGDRLCEGPIDPHDILRVNGDEEVQKYLVNEIQEVYRIQGVKINDKHIETIVRQMMQKVLIEYVGDTNFLEGEKVDKIKFYDENARVIAEGGEPARFQPLLLGITRASLSTESFISAASFQETTKVLTEAAVSGKIDNLLGLKENVIIGHLIPAGTGIERYRSLDVVSEEIELEDSEADLESAEPDTAEFLDN